MTAAESTGDGPEVEALGASPAEADAEGTAPSEAAAPLLPELALAAALDEAAPETLSAPAGELGAGAPPPEALGAGAPLEAESGAPEPSPRAAPDARSPRATPRAAASATEEGRFVGLIVEPCIEDSVKHLTSVGYE